MSSWVLTGVKERVSHIEKAVEMKVLDLEKTVDGKLVMLEEKINNLQNQCE